MLTVDGKHIQLSTTITFVQVAEIHPHTGAKKIEFMDDENTTVSMWLTPEVLAALAKEKP